MPKRTCRGIFYFLFIMEKDDSPQTCLSPHTDIHGTTKHRKRQTHFAIMSQNTSTIEFLTLNVLTAEVWFVLWTGESPWLPP